MLVLSRKKDEKIILQVGSGKDQNNIEITVVRIDANKVRLGFNADENVTIVRSELLDKQKASSLDQ